MIIIYVVEYSAWSRSKPLSLVVAGTALCGFIFFCVSSELVSKLLCKVMQGKLGLQMA